MPPLDVLGFDHLDLTVNDLGRSAPYYEKVLGELGFRRVGKESNSIIFANGITSIAIRGPSEEQRGVSFDRYRVGLHHLALRAASRNDVDRFHVWLGREGIPVLDPPAEYPEYGEKYYAVFFSDPDGLKLELVHYPWGYWRRTQLEGSDQRPRYPRGEPRTKKAEE
jgi:catechol 2,3-dioxygenase-like lactoylglutathione lyase family enzyme